MRGVMHAANLPSVLWPEVLRYVVDVDNLSPTKAFKEMTPTEKLTGKKPIFEEVRKNKLLAKAEPALFLGFPRTGHGYRLLQLRTGNSVETRDVKFREDVTVERTYINALLKGRQHYYPQIPTWQSKAFVSMQVTLFAKR
ncbi:polyprotein [Phytophthora megakarya]|uniref:Polyprotein n=1 Tax=Phytophthora megakarya TaxID=4795 RepID=A0A225V7G2_9STRA|nr:polyprotein [Phytophthora megakarya]